MPRHPLVVTLLGLLTLVPVHAEIYTWKDANGRTVYSETAPPEANATLIAPKATPVPSGAAESQWRKTEDAWQRLRDHQEDRELAREKQARERARKKQRQAACRIARRNLEGYLSLGHRRIRGKDGNYYYPTDQQRAAAIAKARKQIETYCHKGKDRR